MFIARLRPASAVAREHAIRCVGAMSNLRPLAGEAIFEQFGVEAAEGRRYRRRRRKDQRVFRGMHAAGRQPVADVEGGYSDSIARNNARADASGVLRRCSQARKLPMGSPKASANSTWGMPSHCRNAFTGEMGRAAGHRGRRGPRPTPLRPPSRSRVPSRSRREAAPHQASRPAA